MTYFYRWSTTTTNDQISEETKALWEKYVDKKHWRITKLPNGYYQSEFNDDEQWRGVTRRETVEGAEQAIDSSIEHYSRKLAATKGPVVVKTFE